MKLALTTSEAAEAIGVTESTLVNWRRVGQGPRFVRLGYKTVRYSHEDLAHWLAAQTVETGGRDAA